MNVSITEAKAQLTDLVRRAESGETVVLTRHGRPTVRLVPEQPPTHRRLDRALIDRITRETLVQFPDGNRPSSDHGDLYDADGLPK